MGQATRARESATKMIYASAAADLARRLVVDEFRVAYRRHRRRCVGVGGGGSKGALGRIPADPGADP